MNLKDKYIDFFEQHGHKVIPSAPIIPENDPTCLFNTAGMQPLVPYLKGQPHPLGNRLCDVQKCFRTNDLDEVGDTTHHNFFEMSNFSVVKKLKDRYLSIGFYNKYTSDLLASVPFPSSSGVGNQYTNNGSVRNRGIEFEIDATIFKNKDWNIRIGGNATYMRSKIISLPYNGNENNRQGGSQVYNPVTGELMWVGGYQEGQEYGVAYGFQMMDIVRSDEDLQKYAWYDPDSHDHESGDSTVYPRTSSRNSSRQIFCCFIYEAAGMPTYL